MRGPDGNIEPVNQMQAPIQNVQVYAQQINVNNYKKFNIAIKK